MQALAPIITVPRRFWEREYGGYPLPKAVNVTFEVAGQTVDDVSAHGFVSVAEDSELRLSGLWAVSHDRFPAHFIAGWLKVGDDTIRLQLQPPDSADEQVTAIDRKRQAQADLPEPQAKVQALSARQALEWEGSRDLSGHGSLLEWRPERRDGGRLAVETPQRVVSPALLPSSGRLTPRRGGGSAGRMRGGSRSTATGRGCAKLVRTTTRLYIGVGQVREWLGEVGARTELQVKVMLDGRMLIGNHQADLLYNKGAHYYWITSRTLKRAAMGKWFLGWNHTMTDGLVLLLRSPSKDEIAAAIAEGFQGKDDDDETEMSEQQQVQLQMQQQMLLALSPPSPRLPRPPQSRSLAATGYLDDDPMQGVQQHTPASETDDPGEAGPFHRLTPTGVAARMGAAGDEDDAVSGLSGDSELRRALGPSDPRLMVALAAAELQRGFYGGTPGSAGFGRRPTPGQGTGPRGYAAGRDVRETPPQAHGGRAPAGPGLGHGAVSAAVQYREPLARVASEGLNAAPAVNTPSQPRGTPGQPARFTNFSEVPGGTAFANVSLTQEMLATDPPPLLSQQHLRGGAGGPSQLGTTTSIASNLSLPGATQLTGNASLLQASGVAGPIAAPLRLPATVSELLPPEYLPAAVSVRCTLDGNLQPEIFACEIHRSRQGHCYLYNLPPSVLDGRAQQDWMISEDGCLVLCLKTLAQAASLQENKSVRSNPSNPQSTPLAGGGSVNLDNQAGRVNTPGRAPSPGEQKDLDPPLHKDADADAGAAAVKPQPPEFPAGAAGEASAMAQEEAEQLMQSQDPPADAVAYTTVVAPAEVAPVAASLPVLERKSDGRRERPPPLAVPPQVIESLYGRVQLPHPVLVRFQVNGEPDSQVFLAEVMDAGGGELVIRGTPLDTLAGRTLVGWRRANVLSHQLLVVCLEARSESLVQGKVVSAPATGKQGREDEQRGPRNDQPGGQPAAGGPVHGQQQPQPLTRAGDHPPQRASPGEAHAATARQQPAGAAANPFGQQQVSLSCAPAPTSGSLQGNPSMLRQPMASARPGPAPLRQQHQQRRPSGDSCAAPGSPQQPLQPMLSGPLAVVGSSMLPTSNSLLNHTGSSLLPAVASNLPFASSLRPEGHGSAAIGGWARDGGARPANAGGRGGAPVGSVAGGNAAGPQRTQPMDVESKGGGMLPPVASVTQGPMQAPGSRPQGPMRASAQVAMFPWPNDGTGAGPTSDRGNPTVFAQFNPGMGVGQEPPSPKAVGDAPGQGGKRRQVLPAPAGRSGGSGSGGSGPHSGSNEAGYMARSTSHLPEYSSANVGSQIRAAQQHPQQQQPSLHQTGRLDEGEQDRGRSPARGTNAAAANAEHEVAASGRGRWPPGTAPELDAQGNPVTNAGEALKPVRHGSGQGLYRLGSGGDGAGPQAHEAQQQPRPRHDASASWRLEQQQSEAQQPRRMEQDDVAPSQPHASREARWGPSSNPAGDCHLGAEAPRGHRYADVSFPPDNARLPRPSTDDMDTARNEGRPVGSLADRPNAEDPMGRSQQGLGRGGEEQAGGPAGDTAARYACEGGAGPQDVEMEDAATDVPGGVRMAASRPDAQDRGVATATPLNGDGPVATRREQGPLDQAPMCRRMGLVDECEPAQLMHPQRQGSGSWQRRSDAPGQTAADTTLGVYEHPGPQGDPPESSRQRRGSGGTGPAEHSIAQWLPRLDLTGVTALSGGPNAETSEATATRRELQDEGTAQQTTAGEGETNGETSDLQPPRRPSGVLRMLSAVVREPEEEDSQQRRG